ncbi:L,D-transpeptidase family protein [Salinisphaera orenii]|uniref:L,D-TPase catalytic domain-containing protein n=1 Tax=Salinisphaera orenii YIM 95161 TaxID=1051139 RepID=A0A423PPF5_9GAMM|nr:L,D-transpeptidase family protein [Salinisphaera halophila]ROO27479.1 hypothetical protein SAHL_11460 [Salinisphaera halophila YIM 95161]
MKPARNGLMAGLILMTAACGGAPERTDAERTARDRTDSRDTASEAAGPQAGAATARAIRERTRALSEATVDAALADYYAAHDHAPAWLDAEGRPREAVEALLAAVARADRQGLIAADYRADALARRAEAARTDPETLSAADRAALDIALSRVFVQYAADLHEGRVETGDLRPRWYEDLPPADYVGALEHAAVNGNVDAALSELRPPHDGYTRLVKALADYRAIADDGGWPTLPEGPLLEPGVRDARVNTLRERLRLTGDLPSGDNTAPAPDDDSPTAASTDTATEAETRAPRYDDALAAAVERFQRRHGLAVDGRVGEQTLAALNVPATRRVRDIEINLERWRWLPGDLGERYIMVNIPEYRLRAFEDGRPALTMKVVVGETYNDRATPVFSDRMQYVIFRPYWNVPRGIAAEEIVPEARAEPGYLEANRYEIVRAFGPNATPLEPSKERLTQVEAGELFIRQRAGARNALGLVKFMFPNEYAVYLHDSPAERLFSRTERAFSHGCVRVARPDDLAAFVLDGRPDWDAGRIDDALHEGSRKRVDLAESIPVYLMYWTAFVTDEGVQFRPDLYEHDRRVDEALRQAATTVPSSDQAAEAA